MEYHYEDFVGLIQKSIIDHWDLNALTDYKGVTLQYKDVARKIEKLHILFETAGIQPGDKIAICGRNSAHWAVSFLATMTYGAIVVPILHEFKAEQVHNIVTTLTRVFSLPATWFGLRSMQKPCPNSKASFISPTLCCW